MPTKGIKEQCLVWYRRGVRDGRQEVVEGIMTAMGLDYHDFNHMPVSDIETEKSFCQQYNLPDYDERKKCQSDE